MYFHWPCNENRGFRELCSLRYRKIPKISPRAYIFQRGSSFSLCFHTSFRDLNSRLCSKENFRDPFPGLQVGRQSTSDEEVFLGAKKTRMLSYETHQSFRAIQIYNKKRATPPNCSGGFYKEGKVTILSG